MTYENFDHLGVMIDCSRNSVISIDGLHRFLPVLKKLGYNTVLLYTEDTYEVENEPYFGYMRGRYSMKELKEIDDYADSLGMELIPCIQTLAHLNATIRWDQFPVDWDDVVLCDDDRTYELIDHMMSSLSKCFRSKKIHVGMDEAYMLGRGHHQDKHGPENSIDIIRRHLAKVESIAAKYGFEKFLCWSDMFFACWNNRNYFIEQKKVPQEVIDSVGDKTVPVFWDYYHDEQRIYDDMLKNHAQLTDDVWFAGGAWSWAGFVPLNNYSLKTMIPAMRAVKENKVRNVFFTMWGDDGGECSHFSQLAVLHHLAQLAAGIEDIDEIKKSFFDIVGVPYDAFMALDLPNMVKNHEKQDILNPSKYMLFSDYFNDFLDFTVDADVDAQDKQFIEYAKTLREYQKVAGDYAYLFDAEAKLCDVLAVKDTLGYRCRKAYETGDKTELRRLAQEVFPKVAELLPVFCDALEAQWFRDNKPCGFDVQDLRIGGILRRTETCKRRILDYTEGRVSSIPEYEEKILPFGDHDEPGIPTYCNSAKRYTTTNVYNH